MSGTKNKTNENNEQDIQTGSEIENNEKSGQGTGDQGGEGDGGFKSLDEANKEIQKLRKENAKHRTGNKSLEDRLKGYDEQFSKLKKAIGVSEENEDPEKVIQSLNERSAALEMELAIVSAARAANIPSEHEDYFRFLLSKKLEALSDDQEIGEEEIEEIAKEVMKYSGQKKKTTTGIDDSRGGSNQSENSDDVTVEQFKKMGFIQKNELYTRNKELYTKLFEASKR